VTSRLLDYNSGLLCTVAVSEGASAGPTGSSFGGLQCTGIGLLGSISVSAKVLSFINSAIRIVLTDDFPNLVIILVLCEEFHPMPHSLVENTFQTLRQHLLLRFTFISDAVNPRRSCVRWSLKHPVP
jgi:hypothetical protein